MPVHFCPSGQPWEIVSQAAGQRAGSLHGAPVVVASPESPAAEDPVVGGAEEAVPVVLVALASVASVVPVPVCSAGFAGSAAQRRTSAASRASIDACG